MRTAPAIQTCVFALLVASATAQAEAPIDTGRDKANDEAFLGLELHFSILTDLSDRSTIVPRFGYAFKGGYRWGRWGAFLQFEHNLWIATELDTEVVLGAYNIGVGGEVSYFDGRARTSLAVGASILGFDTQLDDAGEVGLFLDLRPIGVRWKVRQHLRLGLDPLGFAVIGPALDGIPLVELQYRTTFWIEGLFK